MKDIALKQIHFHGITMQIPEIWDYETEEYNEEDGSKSYCMNISANGKDVRIINISRGIIPEGSDAYNAACATYEQVVGEDDLDADEEPIICFEFQGKEAFGFNVWTEDGVPCFFFCLSIPEGGNQLVTVLVSAANNEGLQSLVEFTEEYLKVE